MAGEFHVQAKSSTKRKQWKIYRGHRGPFRRLINELAEDDSPESQVMYAKQLFEDSCCEEDDQVEENARLGVYWLLKASEQGHEEATQMLHHCLVTGRGISSQNVEDVKTCLDMPLDEKVSRHAAREIFASLSQGEEYITSDQLSEEMLRVDEKATTGQCLSSSSQQHPPPSPLDPQQSPPGSSCKTPPQSPPSEGTVDQHNASSPQSNDWKSRVTAAPSRKCEKLTEEMLVSAASEHCRGYLPLVHRTLMLERASQSRSILHRIALFPLRHLVTSYRRLIDILGMRVVSPLMVDVYLPLVLVCLYSVFGLEGFIELMPNLLYFGSLTAMVVTSCQILSKKWELSNFRRWSNLLVAYGGEGVNPSEAQWAHCVNNIRPPFMFLLALLLNLSAIPFVPPLSVPHSELAALATLWAFILLYNFMWRKGKLDFLMVISFGTHMFARYPYDADPVVSQGWRFIDVHVPTFSSYVMSNGIEFCLNFRLVLYVLLVLLMVKMSSRDGWRGFFTTLVPHLVCLSWWQMAVISSNGATWYGLIRGCLALFGVVLFLPLAGLSTVLLPLAAIAKSLVSLYYLPLPATVALAIATFISAAYLGLKYRNSFPPHKITWIQVVVMVISGGILLSYIGDTGAQSSADSATLSYPQYLTLCPRTNSGSGGVYESLRAPAHTRCLLTEGLLVSWEGSILATRVSNVYNPLTSLISRMPQGLQETMTCIYGERFISECFESGTCSPLPSALKNKCHLSKWNRYEYEIEVSLTGSGVSSSGIWGSGKAETSDSALLVAPNSFQNLTLSLTPGDKLWFTGRLSNVHISNAQRPTVRLISAGCVACSRDVRPSTLHTSQSDLSLLISASLNSMLHFFLTPLYSFKPV